MQITLPDGTPLELADGATVRDAAAAIGPRLAKAAIAGRVTAADTPDITRLIDVTAPLHDGDRISIVTLKGDDPDAVDILRHSASHIMAQAVLRLFPGTKYAIGPTIENGFYYDFEFPEPITETDLMRLEKEMAKIVSQNLPVERAELPRAEALAIFGPAAVAAPAGPGADQPFKVELIEDLPGRRDHQRLRARRLHRPLPRTAPAEHQQARQRHLQAHEPRRSLLARRREERDAHAHLRHRLRD